jgi:hypothetical protein
MKTPQVPALPGMTPLGFKPTTPPRYVNATAKQINRAAKRKREAEDKLVEQAYYATCSGIQIDIMDIGKVYAFGRLKLEAGEDFEALKASVRAYVETIRKN